MTNYLSFGFHLLLRLPHCIVFVSYCVCNGGMGGYIYHPPRKSHFQSTLQNQQRFRYNLTLVGSLQLCLLTHSKPKSNTCIYNKLGHKRYRLIQIVNNQGWPGGGQQWEGGFFVGSSSLIIFFIPPPKRVMFSPRLFCLLAGELKISKTDFHKPCRVDRAGDKKQLFRCLDQSR